MKAINCSTYGGPEVMQVKEVIKPSVTSDGILIRLKASSISPVDCAFRKGEPFVSRLFTGLTKPKYKIPGDIVSGLIEEIGSDVTKFKVGDRVFGHTGLTFGAHGEYINLKTTEAIIKMSDNMTFDEAATIAYSAMTALPFLREHSVIKKDTKVLINGASGAIGSYAVELAKHFGAEVTGVCGSNNLKMISDIGADHVIDYTKDDYTKANRNYDIIFDAVGKNSYKESSKVLSDKGIYLSTVPDFSLMLRTVFLKNETKKRGKLVATGLRKVSQKLVDLTYLKNLYDQNVIKPVIDRTFEMDEIVEAHKYVDRGHNKGNVIVHL